MPDTADPPPPRQPTDRSQPTGTVTAHRLAGDLRSFVITQLDALVENHLPAWRLPATFGGHRVEPDVAADLVYTLGHLHDAGVTHLAGTPLTDAVVRVLAQVDGDRTHTFFSYRIAETLLRWGPTFEDNPLLVPLTDDQVEQVRRACDSSEWIPLVGESFLPRNYAGVLARCESARLQLGLLGADGDDVVASLVERARGVLSANPLHLLDDSNHGVGRHDIYAADVWLFTEPLAARLGDLWFDGMAAALALVERVMSDDGSAVAWGRSTGPLSGALTVELGAFVAAQATGDPADADPTGDHQPSRADRPGHLGDSPQRWVARAALAAEHMGDWFERGVVNAHRHRDADGYRGPFRRLQLGLDLLGKLAWAANRLSEAPADLTASSLREVLAPLDELVRFDAERPAAVWSRRGPGGGVVVPFVGASRSDYLAAPRSPGCYEVPVDSELACWVPTLLHGDWRAVPSGLPERLEHQTGGVTATWAAFTRDADLEPPEEPDVVGGRATVDYSMTGRTIEARWHLEIERRPDAVVILVPERADRPLRVAAWGDSGTVVHIDEVDVSGIAEWRSHWSSFATLHEIEAVPTDGNRGSATVDLTLSVTPRIRVASSAFGHHYDASLYGPLAGLVHETPCPWGPLGDRAVDAAAIDLLHLHWPEWLAFDDLAAHSAIVDELARRRVPIVWTAHNLTPHEKRPEAYDPIYALWAANAAAVIHHSHVGMERFGARYPSGEQTRHVVIPHGHFGDLWVDHAPVDRDVAEAELGLAPCRLRIGIVGAPRTEKLVTEFLRGVAASSRDDIQVACWSLAEGDEVPDDARIVVAERYDLVDSAVYARRLAACDVLAMPFDPDGEMLATGTVFDAIGLGMPVLRSDWPFLVEVLGDAGLPVGHTAESVAAALDALDLDAVRAARRAAAVRRDELTWDLISARTLTLFEEVLASR